MGVLSSFDLVDFTDDAEPDESLNFIFIYSLPDVLKSLHGSEHVDAQFVVGLDLVVVINLHHRQHGSHRIFALTVLAVSIPAEVARLTLLSEEVFSDSVLRVDYLVTFARFSGEGRYCIVNV